MNSIFLTAVNIPAVDHLTAVWLSFLHHADRGLYFEFAGVIDVHHA